MTDFGVIYAGSPTLKLSGEVDDPTLTAAFQNDLAEYQADIQSQLDDVTLLQFYPVVSLGLSYRF